MLDYETLAKSRLVGQFAKSEKLQNLIAELVGPLTLLENDADAIREQRWIDTATGAQLDGVGAIVQEARRGRTDDVYREAIRFRVFVNTSTATPKDMLRGVRFMTSPTDMQYFEFYPATVMLYTNGFFVDSNIAATIFDLSPAGVWTTLAVSYADKPFRFAKENAPGELFVNNGASYLTANTSDIQVSVAGVDSSEAAFGGVVPAELDVGLGYLEVGGAGATLAVYSPNHVKTIGHNNLTGVF